MRQSSSEEERRVRAHPLEPQRMNDAHPEVREGAQGHALAFARAPFAALVGQRPLLLRGGLPSKLVQGGAPGLDAGPTLARPRNRAALLGNRRGPCQRLDTRCAPNALPVITPSCQQPRREALAVHLAQASSVPALPAGRGGAPRVYQDESLLLLALLRTLWRLSFQEVYDWLVARPPLWAWTSHILGD
jgi:hypothetical protein